MAHRRTQNVGREEILSRQSAGQDGSAHISRHDQSAMDLRTGPSAVERGTRARSLRGTILARPSSSCAHDHDRLRIPPTPPSRTSGAEKKNQRSTASAEPAGRTPRHRRTHRSTTTSAMSATAEDKSAKSSGVNKSAKVVLGSGLIKSTIQERRRGRQKRGSFAPACRSGLRCGGSPSAC